MKRFQAVLLAAAVVAAPVAVGQEAPKRVVLRFASDFTGPPHPAGMAMKHFGDRLPQVIPGSEARLYFAGALYTIPEAFEAMRQGNLEMTWMQMGKAAPVEPWMMAVVGPGILTTAGAVDNLEKTKTYQMLVERLEKRQAIKVFGASAWASAARSATSSPRTSSAARSAAWGRPRTRCSSRGRRTRW